MTEAKSLTILTRARRDLAEAKSLEGIAEIRDIAKAAEAYARAAHLGQGAVNEAIEVRLLAERKAGEMLAQMPNLGQGGDRKSSSSKELDSLADLGIEKKESMSWQSLAEIPEEKFTRAVTQLKSNGARLSGASVARVADADKRRKANRDAKSPGALAEGIDWALHLGDMRDIGNQIPDGSIDALVTDPPYPAEYLPLYADLANLAARVLRPGGLLAVMSGQTHLPAVFQLLSGGLDYFWTMAYLTPGMETRIWNRAIWTHWKPVLLFSNGDPGLNWTTDTVVSPKADKQYHDWGQTIRGMSGLVEALTEPGDIVLDPFAGACATGLATVSAGRKFIGIELDVQVHAVGAKRLNDATAA